MKRTKAGILHQKWKFSPVATLLFLFAAAAILYGCTVLVSTVARNALHPGEMRSQQAALSPTPSLSSTPEAALNVAAIHTPPDVSTPTPPVDTPTPTPIPVQATKAPTPSPAPTLLPVQDAPAVSSERADLLLIGMNATPCPEWILVVQIHGRSCRALSIPCNTMVSKTRQLSDAGSAKTCANLLTHIWPFRYAETVTLQTEGLPTFVDQFGGITLDGTLLDGASTAAYLASGPKDELLRIERQQRFMHAYIEKLRSLRLLAILSSRFAFEPYIDSTLDATDLLTLLELMRNLDMAAITFHTLPVDSIMLDGIRRYVPDTATVNRVALDWRA